MTFLWTRWVVVSMTSVSLTMAGCSHSELVGRWQGSLPGGPASTNGTFEFRPNGTYEQTVDVMGQRLTRTGTYTAGDERLVLHTNDIQTNGVSVRDRMAPQMAHVMMQDVTLSHTSNGDQLTLRLGTSTGTLERVKQ